MRILRSSKEVEISDEDFLSRLEGYSKLIIDLGTGQGSFIYFNAIKNKNCFYIGLDSCGDSMKKYSVKQYKNRIDNLIYIIMNAQNMHGVLENKFSEIYINLPWGTLLEGIFKEDLGVISSISKISINGCKLNICFSYEERFEKIEIEKRNLPILNDKYFSEEFIPMYKKYGFNIESIDYISKDELGFRSKWMHVLSRTKDRKFYTIVGSKNNKK